MTNEELEALRAEETQLKAKIELAYWSFSRTKRGKPPILVIPEVYARLREVRNLLPWGSNTGE